MEVTDTAMNDANTQLNGQKLDVSEKLTKVKHQGKVYTPDYLVKIILDRGHYCDETILKKHIIDPSAGDGQFMVEIVKRYCQEFRKSSDDLNTLKNELEKYIHAIEIDAEELRICEKRCSQTAEEFGVESVKWDFLNADTTTIDAYDGKMDYVVGNPPYVRIHNLRERATAVKEHLFCQNGMTDLYILFYEIGIKMLNKTGILAYISSSSFFTSLAGASMREYIYKNNLLVSICDLKHFQPFKASTYTAIVVLQKHNTYKNISYAEFNEETLMPIEIGELTPEDYWIDNKFYFADQKSLRFLRNVLECSDEYDFSVKNGYATLADKVFVGDFSFASRYIIPVVKASRGKATEAIYPYDMNGKLYSESELFEDANIKDYLLARKDMLVKRSNEKDSKKYWYAFGRSQGIIDTYKDKLSLNTLIKSKKDIKCLDCPPGTGVYSGLYVISETISLKKIKKILVSDNFCTFVSLLGKYKLGGCYTFSSKDVTAFLNYQLSKGEI